MLQLSLGYVFQAEREREVAADLRNRQALLPARDDRTSTPVPTNPSPVQRRPWIRVRGVGA